MKEAETIADFLAAGCILIDIVIEEAKLSQDCLNRRASLTGRGKDACHKCLSNSWVKTMEGQKGRVHVFSFHTGLRHLSKAVKGQKGCDSD